MLYSKKSDADSSLGSVSAVYSSLQRNRQRRWLAGHLSHQRQGLNFHILFPNRRGEEKQ